MHILNVKIENQSRNAKTGLCSATLVLTTRDGCVSLRARTNCPDMAGAERLRSRLVADALRQLRRMPEYRSGARQVTLAGDICAAAPEPA